MNNVGYIDNLSPLLLCVCMICIYDDGVHNNTYIQAAIESFLPVKTKVCFVSASMILGGCLDHARLLIMPGGADLYYCEKLNGTGNEIIRRFVENGGSYLGICAGAYYACRDLNWNNGDITGSRELEFVQTTATGPVFEWIEDGDVKKSWIRDSALSWNGEEFPTLYEGGCLFCDLTDENVTVLARYTELKTDNAAIVETKIGKGRVILSSPHIEKFGKALADTHYKIHSRQSYYREAEVIKRLQQAEEQQKRLFAHIIKRLLPA